ncbi:uncharacterized protein [Mobula birostris]|uniref:uncharacterized protein isoform X3 n=1 Tax=Mobula birostris TaxID=1983395 RepID=UPI003B285B00
MSGTWTRSDNLLLPALQIVSSLAGSSQASSSEEYKNEIISRVRSRAEECNVSEVQQSQPHKTRESKLKGLKCVETKFNVIRQDLASRQGAATCRSVSRTVFQYPHLGITIGQRRCNRSTFNTRHTPESTDYFNVTDAGEMQNKNELDNGSRTFYLDEEGKRVRRELVDHRMEWTGI